MIKAKFNAKIFSVACMFSSKDDVRYYLQGVFIEKAKEGVILTATDGHRLISINDKEGELKGDPILVKNNKFLLSLCKKVKGEKSERTVSIDGFSATVRNDKELATVSDILIDGTFPKWMSFVPKIDKPSPAAYNASYLNDFGRAGKLLNGNNYIKITGTEGGAAIVNFYNYDDAFGVLMPVRFLGLTGVPSFITEKEGN